VNFGSSKPVILPKLRRSKSHADLNLAKTKPSQPVMPFRVGMKRPNTAIENIPIKRLKPAAPTRAPTSLNIKTQEKKNAIISTLKSSALVTTNLLKRPLVKSNSAGVASSSNAAAKMPLTKAAASYKKPVAVAAAPAPAAVKTKPKIPPYDFKARFLDLKERYDAIKVKNDEQKEQIATLEDQTDNFDTRERELLDNIEKLEFELFEATDAKEKLENELASLKQTNKCLLIKNNALAADLNCKSEDLSDTKEKLADLTKKHDKQTREFEELKKSSGTLKSDFEEASTKLKLAEEQLFSINVERKVLHNMVLDLRGNIRVFARVRPPLKTEEERMLCGWTFNDESSMEINTNELVPSTGARKQTKYDFAFDQVFNPNTTQEDIFDMVSPLIQSAMDGYNICIFAYGQTGSGK
jgi:kinesin family protein C1